MSKGAPGVRYAEIDRETAETRIHLVLDLDGGTRCDVKTGVAFFDHMLHQFAFHGYLDLGVQADGDLVVDDHHTVEDVGIALGQALQKALVESDVARYGDRTLVMDEARVLVAIDLSGRPHLTFDVAWQRENLGGLATENVREFFQAVALHGRLSLHIVKQAGLNDHHVCEAIFKAFGQALHAATRRTERRGIPSTKGVL